MSDPLKWLVAALVFAALTMLAQAFVIFLTILSEIR